MSCSSGTPRLPPAIGWRCVFGLFALLAACGSDDGEGGTTSGQTGMTTSATEVGSTTVSTATSTASTGMTGLTSTTNTSDTTDPVTSTASTMMTSSTTELPDTDSGATTSAETSTSSGDDGVPACVFIGARDVGAHFMTGIAFSPDDTHLLFKQGLNLERLGWIEIDSEDPPTFFYEGALTNGPLRRGAQALFFGAEIDNIVGIYRQAMNDDGSPQGPPLLIWGLNEAFPPPVLSISANGQWFAFSSIFENLSFGEVEGDAPSKLSVQTYEHIPSDDGTTVYHVTDSDSDEPPYPLGAFAVISGETTPVVNLPEINDFAAQPGAHEWVWSHYSVDDPVETHRIFRFNVDTGEIEDLCDLDHPDILPLTLSRWMAVASDDATFAVKSDSNAFVYIAAVP